MKRTLILALGLALVAILFLALPLTAQAEDYIDRNSMCMAVQNGEHRWRFDHTDLATDCLHPEYTIYYCTNCKKYAREQTGPVGPHQFPSTWDRLKDPTCTAAGQDIHYCTVCYNAYETRDVPALGHQWDGGKVTTAATCTAAGVKTYTCTRRSASGAPCGATKTESIPALGHSMGEWKTVKAATCTAEGQKERVCTRCGGAKETQAIPKTGHKPQTVAGYAATCTTAGKSDGSKCSVCGAVLTAQKDIPALGHNWGEWKQDEPGTCVQRELLAKKCTRCGAVEYKYGEFGDHDWGEWTVVKEPTATEEGLKERVCKNDASHKEQEAIPATGEPAVEEKPALKLTVYAFPDEEVYHLGDEVGYDCFLTNTGNVPLHYMPSFIIGKTNEDYANWSEFRTVFSGDIDPGEERNALLSTVSFYYTLGDMIPDPEDSPYAGTCRVTWKFYGYAMDDTEFTTPLCESNSVTIDYKIAKDDEIHPALHLEITWAPDAGEGKRVEGATVPLYCKVTNTGNCTVYAGGYVDCVSDIVYPNGEAYVPGLGWTAAAIQPGESWTYTWNRSVVPSEVENGFIEIDLIAWENYLNADGKNKIVGSNNVTAKVPLTYPDGATPEEEAKPGLTLIENFDYYYAGGGGIAIPTTKDTFDVDDKVFVNHSVINTGNVPLHVLRYYTAEGASTGSSYTDLSINLSPGKSRVDATGRNNLGTAIKPGTETADLLGTVNVSFYYVGYDPATFVDRDNPGTELCRTETVSRVWKVRKPGNTPWPIPELSDMDMKIETSCGGPSDPAGYQLGEGWYARIWIYNTGLVDIDSPVIHADYEAAHALVSSPMGPNWVEMPYVIVFEPGSYAQDAISGHVKEEDVQRGYIEVSGYVKWTDPDTGAERIAYSNVWNMPVISKTGLLLKKGASDPPNGAYFLEGEPIKWSLDVTNNSKEDVTDITVNDLGVNVGAFAKLAAGETQPVTVPDHTVTAYEAEVVGYVTNYAMATGKDLAGIEHTWPSNPAKALTKQEIPPVGPGGGTDPLGPVYGVNPAVSIIKSDTFGPPDGESYKAGDEAIFTITVTNTGDCELNDLKLYDSLEGFSPIATLASLKPGKSHSFAYKYTITQPNVDHGFVINSATLTYTFLGGIPGTPMPSNKCKLICGDGSGITDGDGGDIPPFDPEILEELLGGDDDDGDVVGDGNHCALTLDVLGANEADYTLHACARHAELARAAEDAVLNGDSASPIWRAELNNLYEALFTAASDEAKADLLWEREQYLAYVNTLEALAGEEAAAEALRLKVAELCCMIHTFPETLPNSLTGSYAEMLGMTADAETSSREIGLLEGDDAPVKETYAGPAARALDDTLALLHTAKSYDADDVFLRGQTLWQVALDEQVNPFYQAADRDTRKLIAAWRVTLDSTVNAERPFLELLYRENSAVIEEVLMNLYRDSALEECVE